MSLPDTLSFDPGFGLLPAGLPLSGWHTESASGMGSAYFVAENGRLILNPVSSNLSLRSDDATGFCNFTAAAGDLGNRHKLALHLHGGFVIHIALSHQQDGFKWPPTWMLDEEHFRQTTDDNVEQLIALIRACNAYGVEDFDNEPNRLMVALALCRPELLKSTRAAQAWHKLSPSQRTAVTTWWV